MHLKNTTSKCVINAIESLFARHGVPDILSDNGPQYSSQEFREFAASWNFHHVTSSPTHPKSNGLAENGVKAVTKILQKSPHHYFKGLLAYRASPLSCSQFPAELLMKSRIKTNVPIHPMLLKGENDAEIVQKKMEEKTKQKSYNDRTSQNLPPLQPGQEVQVYDKKEETWQKSGTVLEKVAPRSYSVQIQGGGVYRRNRQDLKRLRSPEKVKPAVRESVADPNSKTALGERASIHSPLPVPEVPGTTMASQASPMLPKQVTPVKAGGGYVTKYG